MIATPVATALDSTGLESRHVSRHYARRCRFDDPSTHACWPKLTLVVDLQAQWIVAATTGQGPANDVTDFVPVLRQAVSRVAVQSVLADAGYDSENNHRVARQELGVRRTAIRLNRRSSKGPPQGRYRAQMFWNFPRRKYAQRSQVESAISRFKRCLGSALSAKKPATQATEMLWKVLTYNLMLLRRRIWFQQSQTVSKPWFGHAGKRDAEE